MKLGEHQEAFALDLARLILKASELGYGARLAEVFRTEYQQEEYFRTGKSKTMFSLHLKKCAADIYFTSNGKLVYPKELGEYWESLDPINKAGMNFRNFKDSPHYQRTV